MFPNVPPTSVRFDASARIAMGLECRNIALENVSLLSIASFAKFLNANSSLIYQSVPFGDILVKFNDESKSSE